MGSQLALEETFRSIGSYITVKRACAIWPCFFFFLPRQQLLHISLSELLCSPIILCSPFISHHIQTMVREHGMVVVICKKKHQIQLLPCLLPSGRNSTIRTWDRTTQNGDDTRNWMQSGREFSYLRGNFVTRKMRVEKINEGIPSPFLLPGE